MNSPVEIFISDPREPVIDPSAPLTRLALRFIRDARDIPFLKLAALQSAILIPFAAYFFLAPRFSWLLAILYWVLVFAVFLAPYTLMLHNTSHRRLFRPKWELFNQYIPSILGPLFGQSPGTYYAHHVGMHHPENNLEPDLSSTMHYQRDSFWHFMQYYGRFMYRGAYDLVAYFRRNGRHKLARQALVGELVWFALVLAGAAVSWRATLVVLVVPLVVIRFLMMAGNWGQHAFIDAAAPDNCYRNSITCINSGYNRRAFNDGYHIGHHLSATRHWTDMPTDFLATRERYIAEQAIVFAKVDFFIVWLFLMLKRYDWLARCYVALDGKTRPRDELIDFLRVRTQRIPRAVGA